MTKTRGNFDNFDPFSSRSLNASRGTVAIISINGLCPELDWQFYPFAPYIASVSTIRLLVCQFSVSKKCFKDLCIHPEPTVPVLRPGLLLAGAVSATLVIGP